jgi:hypothetical protein
MLATGGLAQTTGNADQIEHHFVKIDGTPAMR